MFRVIKLFNKLIYFCLALSLKLLKLYDTKKLVYDICHDNYYKLFHNLNQVQSDSTVFENLKQLENLIPIELLHSLYPSGCQASLIHCQTERLFLVFGPYSPIQPVCFLAKFCALSDITCNFYQFIEIVHIVHVFSFPNRLWATSTWPLSCVRIRTDRTSKLSRSSFNSRPTHSTTTTGSSTPRYCDHRQFYSQVLRPPAVVLPGTATSGKG